MVTMLKVHFSTRHIARHFTGSIKTKIVLQPAVNSLIRV